MMQRFACVIRRVLFLFTFGMILFSFSVDVRASWDADTDELGNVIISTSDLKKAEGSKIYYYTDGVTITRCNAGSESMKRRIYTIFTKVYHFHMMRNLWI